MQHDLQPMNFCFTSLSRTSCVFTWRDMECAPFLALILLWTFSWRPDRTGGCLFCNVYFIYPSFLWPLLQALSIFKYPVCAETLVLSGCLYHVAGHKQPRPRPLKSTHWVYSTRQRSHIAWYVPSELYIEADHTTVVWPLFKKKA